MHEKVQQFQIKYKSNYTIQYSFQEFFSHHMDNLPTRHIN